MYGGRHDKPLLDVGGESEGFIEDEAQVSGLSNWENGSATQNIRGGRASQRHVGAQVCVGVMCGDCQVLKILR